MKKRLAVVVLLAVAVVMMSIPALAQEPEGGYVHKGRLDPDKAHEIAANTDDPIVAADALNDAWLNEEALAVLENSGREDADVLWRLARSRVNIGENYEEAKDAEDLYIAAMAEAEKAAELAPDNADANLQVAVCAGRVALVRGIFKASGLAKKTYYHAHLAKTLSDSIPVAYYILGSAHMKIMEKPGLIRKAAGLGFADADSINYYFQKALDISHGNMIQCHLEYARNLIEEKETEKAKQMLTEALDLPLRDEQDQKYKKEVEELLSEM